MKKKMKKSTWLSLALFAYVSVMAIYFLPRNTEIGDTEKYLTLGASYVIVLLLWFVLRKKEKMQERRKEQYLSDKMNDEQHTNELKEKEK